MISADTLEKTYTRHIRSILDNRPDLTPFFVTTVIKRVPLEDALSWRLPYPFLSHATWNVYSRFYRHLVSRLTNNWQDKRHLLPLTFDCFDIRGSKVSVSIPVNRNEIPHIHSIYLVHQDVLPRFSDLADSGCREILFHPAFIKLIHSVEILPVDDMRGVVSYSSKFARNVYVQKKRNDVDLVFQQPIALSETTRAENRKLLSLNPRLRPSLKRDCPIHRLLRSSDRHMKKRFKNVRRQHA